MNEILREIYWEAKRAPTDRVDFDRNPYKRERYMKKYFGKTREERKATKAAMKEFEKMRIKEVDEMEV